MSIYIVIMGHDTRESQLLVNYTVSQQSLPFHTLEIDVQGNKLFTFYQFSLRAISDRFSESGSLLKLSARKTNENVIINPNSLRCREDYHLIGTRLMIMMVKVN